MDTYMNANIVFSKFSRDYMALKKDLPIRPSEMGVLNIITRREGDFTPLMIAELLGVSKPMIAAHLQVLLKKGYIYKEAYHGDKRSFYVRPTEKAKALADEFEAKQTEYLKAIEARLGEAGFIQLTHLLGETQNVLDAILKK
ncbi:MAG: MarR family transcriptional regulator [Clostridia bacterium]|nr:MarR family transcriptional regulator [Clostridia bacterium]